MSQKSILKKLMTKADSAEVYSVRGKTLSVSFDNNKIKDASTSDLGGMSVRVLKDNKIGFSASSEPKDNKIAKYASDLVEYGKKVNFDFSPKTDVKPFRVSKSDYDSIDENRAIEDCEKAVNELRALHPEVLASASLTKSERESRIMTSRGLDFSQRTIRMFWMCAVTYNTEGNFLTVYDFDQGTKYGGFEKIVKTVKENFELCQKNESVKTGNYRVLISPKGFMDLLMVFTSCLSGFAVAKKISPWADKIGEQIFDERITIISDLISKKSSFRRALDDEGTPTGSTPLIEKGVLKSFYHTLDTAAQCGHKPTGHAYRGSYESMPNPSLDGMVFLPGESKLKDMKKDAEIWIDNLMGSIMSNPFSGVISGNIAMGYTMKNGKRKGRIKDAMLSINVFDALKNHLIAISKESERSGYGGFFNTFDAPWLLVDGVSISAGKE